VSGILGLLEVDFAWAVGALLRGDEGRELDAWDQG
jgi:hypothetical protein